MKEWNLAHIKLSKLNNKETTKYMGRRFELTQKEHIQIVNKPTKPYIWKSKGRSKTLRYVKEARLLPAPKRIQLI